MNAHKKLSKIIAEGNNIKRVFVLICVLSLFLGAVPVSAANEQRTVILIASPSNGGIVSGGGTYDYNEPFTITATPNPGWTFDGWYFQDGRRFNTDATARYRASFASSSVTYEARFTQIDPNTVNINAEINRLERKYNIRINIDNVQEKRVNAGRGEWVTDNAYTVLMDIDGLFSLIPPELLGALVTYWAAKGEVITIRVRNVSGVSYYRPPNALIDMNSEPPFRFYSLAHEFSHMLHYTLGDYNNINDPNGHIHSSGEFIQKYIHDQFVELNSGYPYLNNDNSTINAFNSQRHYHDPSIFARGYAMTNWKEDFADTFAWATLFGTGYLTDLQGRYSTDDHGLTTFTQVMDGAVMQKAQLIEQVVREYYDIDRVFPISSGIPQLPLPPPLNPFADVSKSDWFYDAVVYMRQAGLMVGVGGDRFGAGADLSRAMVVTILYRHAGRPDVGNLQNPFRDVLENTWYTDAVKWAYANDVVQGYGNGRFGTNDPVTNEQLAVLIYRMQRSAGLVPPRTGGVSFQDTAGISPWAAMEVRELNNQGLFADLPGRNFNPQRPASRAAVASVLYRWLTAL